MDEIWIRIGELAVAAIVIAIAVFAGARLAFGHEHRRKQKLRRNIEADGLQSAIYVVCRQQQLASKIQAEVLEPFRGDRNRDILVPPISGRHLSVAGLDFQWVSHMLRGDKDSAALAFLFVMVSDGIQSLQDAAEKRRKFHHNRIQPRLEEASVAHLSEESAQQVRFLCGAADSEMLQGYTDQLYIACDRVVAQAQQALSEAQRVCALEFPGYVFHFDLPQWAHYWPLEEQGSL